MHLQLLFFGFHLSLLEVRGIGESDSEGEVSSSSPYDSKKTNRFSEG